MNSPNHKHEKECKSAPTEKERWEEEFTTLFLERVPYDGKWILSPNEGKEIKSFISKKLEEAKREEQRIADLRVEILLALLSPHLTTEQLNEVNERFKNAIQSLTNEE